MLFSSEAPEGVLQAESGVGEAGVCSAEKFLKEQKVLLQQPKGMQVSWQEGPRPFTDCL